eukprot:TRINITY_DN7270_c0_g1_i1.p1 TRINITY_DN7270_c0_g1~~TRINITY_DN7270_c0_g1_i1.p1  ORF type:complete len:761 (+),score=148.75 TRINITY_DN7270_c0_g1_i1:51-2285(+)
MSDDEDYLDEQDYGDDDDDMGDAQGGSGGGGSGDWSRLMRMMEDDKSEEDSNDDILSNWVNNEREGTTAQQKPSKVSEPVVPEPVKPEPVLPQPVAVKKITPPSQSSAVAVARKKPSRKRAAPESSSAPKTAEQIADEEKLLQQLKLEMGDSDEDLGESSDEEEMDWDKQQSQPKQENIKVRKVELSSDISSVPISIPMAIVPPQPTAPVSIPSPRSAFTGSPKTPPSVKTAQPKSVQSDIAKPIMRPTTASTADTAQPVQRQVPTTAASPTKPSVLPPSSPQVSSVPIPISRQTEAPSVNTSSKNGSSDQEPADPDKIEETQNGNLSKHEPIGSSVPEEKLSFSPEDQNDNLQAQSLAAMLFPDDEPTEVTIESENNRTSWIHSMLGFNGSGTSIKDTWENMSSKYSIDLSMPEATARELRDEKKVLSELQPDKVDLNPPSLEDQVVNSVKSSIESRGNATPKQFLNAVVNGAIETKFLPEMLKKGFKRANKLETLTEKGKQRMSRLYTVQGLQHRNVYWKDSTKEAAPPTTSDTFVIGLSVHSQQTGKLISMLEVFSNHKVSILHDILRCDISSHLIKTTAEDTDLILPDPDASLLMLANGVFYLRKKSTSIDLLTAVKDWTPKGGRQNPWAYCDERDIDDTTFGDLLIDIGDLILFRHHGRCDHFLRLNHISAVESSECLLPRVVFSSLTAAHPLCYICDFPASFMCSYCPQLPGHSLVCGDCKSKLTDVRSFPIGLPSES